jgi:signal transduction histidine kinase
MPNTSKFKIIVVVSALVCILLSVLFFAKAVSLGEFAAPGQVFYQGRSNLLLVIAFALLVALALALLAIVFRSPGTSVSVRTGKRRSSAPVIAGNEAAQVDDPAVQTDAGRLLSQTAGEIRTSVEVIQDELEEIIDEEGTADKEQIQSLYEETDRIRKIIDGMEQLSKAQALARSLKKEPLQVEPLLSRILEEIRPASVDRNIIFQVECEPGLTIMGDSDCVSTVIRNITNNAVEAIKASGTVTLVASSVKGQVIITVKDTGTGIRPRHLGHIYERFFRGTGSGIGMGLAIVKELADACGAEIDVQTEAGKGTTFTVTLPKA